MLILELLSLLDEMCQFTHQDTKPQFAFSLSVVALAGLFSGILATVVIFTSTLIAGIATFLTIFFTLLAILGEFLCFLNVIISIDTIFWNSHVFYVG